MFDLLPLLAAVERGRMALPLQLSGVASTLQVAGFHFSVALKESLKKSDARNTYDFFSGTSLPLTLADHISTSRWASVLELTFACAEADEQQLIGCVDRMCAGRNAAARGGRGAAGAGAAAAAAQ